RMNLLIPIKYIRISLLLSFAISLTIHFSLMAEFFLKGRPGHHEDELTLTFAAFEFFTTVFLAFVVFCLNYFFYTPFDIYKKLNFKKIAGSVIATILVVSILIFLFMAFKDLFHFKMNPHRHNDELLSRNFFCAAIVLVCVFIFRLIQRQQIIEIENEKLRSESLQSQFESLKNQVSPHFLFNSLTALKILIEESPELAKQYVNHLSQVLRYTLQSKRKQLVTLEEELEFTESYVFLLKMRYDTNLQIKTEISKEFSFYNLPPLTIQTLIENAVKHNEISNEFPLEIRIFTTENATLQVINKIQEKLTPEDGTGIGLTNLSRLFSLLGENDIQIFKDEHEFKVEVPLIKA
ncbi:MAG TPA: histidine kinase, partial [Draconibacterium sp.]|nr:histidine kinase [Draconibacterium sp.]